MTQPLVAGRQRQLRRSSSCALAREQMGEATLLGHALSLVGQGRTTIEEAMRIAIQIET